MNKDTTLVKELVFDICGLSITDFEQHGESTEYAACSFTLSGKQVQQRTAKITPTKTGQFVTIWKRNKEGITEPFDFADNLDYIIIITRSEQQMGLFVFPKSVLALQGIISQNSKGGKRGIRVYPPWDVVSSKQAEKTQQWQSRYFIHLSQPTSPDPEQMKQYFV